MQILSSALGDFSLEHIPSHINISLLAWDAADHYLLQHCKDQ
jgi:hypothetical protein